MLVIVVIIVPVDVRRHSGDCDAAVAHRRRWPRTCI